MTDFTIIFRSLSTRMFSTVITVLTVAVAVGLMLVLLSMRDSGRRAFERGSGNMHLLVSRDASPLDSVLNGVFYAKAPPNAIAWSEYERLLNGPIAALGGAPLGAVLEYAIPVQQGDSYRGFPTLATTPEFFTAFRPTPEEPWRLAQGRFFQDDFEVVVGARAARLTGAKPGDTIHLTHGAGSGAAGGHVHEEYAFTVVGVLEPTGSAHDRALFLSLQSSWILHAFDRREKARREAAGTSAQPAGGHDQDHDDPDHVHTDECEHDHEHDHEPRLTAADLTDADRLITGIYLRAPVRPEFKDSSAAWQPIFNALRANPTITVVSPAKQIEALFGIVSNIDQVLLAMAAVVMLSSGIGIMLALYNSMEQRRRQVAVLRVLGCSRPRIFSLVLTESAMLGALGAAAGVVLCLVGVRAVAAVMRERLGLVIEPVLTADWLLGVVAGAILLAALAGVVPAVMAYRTSVAKNLRPLG
jgi:putative ABC transport system permease protein